jgi:hypothetical protein
MELGLTLAVAASLVANAPTFVLEWLTDSSVNPPGVPGQFSIIRVPPESCNGAVLFLGVTYDDIRLGLYSVSSAGVEVIANTGTPIPGSTGTFQDARQPSCAGDGIVFLGDDDLAPSSAGPSAYLVSQGVIEPLLVVGTVIGDNSFTGFGDVSGSDSMIALDAKLVPTSTTEAMTIKPFDGEPFIVADRTTVLPGQTEPATIYSLPVLHGSDFFFHARTLDNLGIYRWSQGEGLSVVVDTQTPAPVPGAGNFAIFDSITSLDYGLVFGACYVGSGCGIFVWDAGRLQPLVVPGHETADGHTITSAGFAAGGGSLLSFTAKTSTNVRDAVFARTADGAVVRLLGELDVIDGQTVVEVLSSADDTGVALLLDIFGNPPTEAIYKARFVNTVEIPALSGAGVLAFVLLLAMAAVWLIVRRPGLYQARDPRTR